jgi:hypothetical protein
LGRIWELQDVVYSKTSQDWPREAAENRDSLNEDILLLGLVSNLESPHREASSYTHTVSSVMLAAEYLKKFLIVVLNVDRLTKS